MKTRYKRTRKANYWPLVILALSVAFCLVLVTTAFAAVDNPNSRPSPRKAAVMTQVATHEAVKAHSPHAPKHPLSPPAACPYNIQTGIFPYRAGGGLQEDLVNVAGAVSSQGIPYQIYAGALNNDPQQGILIVMQFQKDPCASTSQGTSEKSYTTSFRQGALTLTRIVGDTVFFKTVNGSTGHFNFVTGQFLSS